MKLDQAKLEARIREIVAKDFDGDTSGIGCERTVALEVHDICQAVKTAEKLGALS